MTHDETYSLLDLCETFEDAARDMRFDITVPDGGRGAAFEGREGPPAGPSST